MSYSVGEAGRASDGTHEVLEGSRRRRIGRDRGRRGASGSGVGEGSEYCSVRDRRNRRSASEFDGNVSKRSRKRRGSERRNRKSLCVSDGSRGAGTGSERDERHVDDRRWRRARGNVVRRVCVGDE